MRVRRRENTVSRGHLQELAARGHHPTSEVDLGLELGSRCVRLGAAATIVGTPYGRSASAEVVDEIREASASSGC